MKLKDLLEPTRVYDVTIMRRLGEGSQGEVYFLDGFSKNSHRYVLKLYHASPSSPQGRHLISFANFIKTQQNLKVNPSLILPIRVVIDQVENRIGYIMSFAPGRPLEGVLYNDLFNHPNGMLARLYVARGLAETIATLHRHHIVSGDIAESNLHLDMKSLMIFHTDLDGGGILTSVLENKFVAGLNPIVRGHMEGSSMAPELFKNQNMMASLAADRWSLAVVIHKLLFAGLDPYFAESTYQKIVDQETAWPIYQSSEANRQKYIPFHLAELRRLGPLVNQRLSAVFHQNQNDWHPELRPTAEDWARDLSIAIEWIQICPECGQEFVYERLRICPFCQRAIRPTTVWTQRAGVLIDRQGKSLLGADLGFKDRQGRYIVAVFSRIGGKLFMLPQIPMFDPTCHRQYDPSESIQIDPHMQTLTFRARSNDGQQHTEFRICN